jgi:hypothetical protein
MSGVGILEEPIFAGALMGPLTLDDMGTYELDEVMDELTEKLRLKAQEEVCEVGKVRGLDCEFSVAVECRGERAEVRSDGVVVVKGIKKVSHVDDEVLQLADAQTLDEKVGFARKEQLVVGSKGG